MLLGAHAGAPHSRRAAWHPARPYATRFGAKEKCSLNAPQLTLAFTKLDRDVESLMEADGTPGLSLVVTDRDQTLTVRCYGYRDLAAQAAVTPETVFQIGSVGKSFTALVLLRLQEHGLIDLDAPVQQYLPWFSVQSAHDPIRVTHLLSHTAGIINGSDMAYDGRFESYALRDYEVSGPPGERFHYSNIGYKTLGLVIEAVTGRTYADMVREIVLEPLGMDATVVPITNADRPSMAVAYRSLHDDRPRPHGGPLVPATWIETSTADGGLASTPEDMGRYLRMLLAGGQGPTGRIVEPDSFRAFTTPVATRTSEGTQALYALGISRLERDGRTILCHAGGMIGYTCYLACDIDAGLGVFAAVNGPGKPNDAALRALALARAALAGTPIEDRPPTPGPFEIPDTSALAGNYRSDKIDLRLTSEGTALTAEIAGLSHPLQRCGDDRFLIDDPELGIYALRLVRDPEGVVTGITHGPAWFARAGTDEVPMPDDSGVWDPYLGHYRCHNPWLTHVRVVRRRETLLLVFAEGYEEPLNPLADGLFRVGDPPSPERVRFDAHLDGKAQRLDLSGQYYYRTPAS